MADRFNPSNGWTRFSAFAMDVVQGTGQVVYLKGQLLLVPSALRATVQVNLSVMHSTEVP